MSRHRAKNRTNKLRAARHRRRPQHHVTTWLGAGALTVGVGAALAAGSGIAHADGGSGPSTTSRSNGTPSSGLAGATTSPGSVGSSAPSDPARSGAPAETTAGPLVVLKKPAPLAAAGIKHSVAADGSGGATVKAFSAAPSSAPPVSPPTVLPSSIAARGTVAPSVTAAATTSSVSTASVTAAVTPAPSLQPAPSVPPAATVPVAPLQSPLQSLLNQIVNAALVLTAMNPTTPTPTTPLQLVVFVVAQWLEDTLNPAGIPRAATPVVGSANPTTGSVAFQPKFTDAAAAPLAYTVSTDPTRGTVTVNPDGTYIFRPTQASRLQAPAGGGVANVTVTAFNGAQTATQNIPVPIMPASPQVLATVEAANGNTVTINSTGSQLIITPRSSVYSDDMVKVFDTYSDTVTAKFLVGPTVPIDAAITPDGLAAYIANPGSAACPTCGTVGTVSEVSLLTDTVIATIPVGYNPQGVAVGPANTPAAGKVYVANSCDGGESACQSGQGTVSVISTATNKVIATLKVGPNGFDLAASPNGKFVYVHNEDGTVSVIDTTMNRVTETLQTDAEGLSYGPGPTLAVSPNGKYVYVIGWHNSFTNYVLDVITTATGFADTEVPLTGYPDAIAVSPDGSVVYVADGGTTNAPGTTVDVISTATDKVIDTITVGRDPTGIAVSPDGSQLFVSTGDGLTVVGI